MKSPASGVLYAVTEYRLTIAQSHYDNVLKEYSKAFSPQKVVFCFNVNAFVVKCMLQNK